MGIVPQSNQAHCPSACWGQEPPHTSNTSHVECLHPSSLSWLVMKRNEPLQSTLH